MAEQKKQRQPKPVTDLPTATTALMAAKRKAGRTALARAKAEQADRVAQRELTEAQSTVKRYYAELMGADTGESGDE